MQFCIKYADSSELLDEFFLKENLVEQLKES